MNIIGTQRRRIILYLTILSLSVLTISCEKQFDALTATEDINNKRPDCRSCSILFIGSSYLSYIGNDVVEIFRLMTEAGNKSVYVESRALGGFRMSDHSESPGTIAKINERDWDFIILQGNSALISKEKWHYMFLPYLEEMKRIIKSNKKTTCIIYMMPWAYLDGLAWIPGETDTYEEMQQNIYTQTISIMKQLDISTAPAGWIWKKAIDLGFDEDLYLNDFNHQGFAGAYLTACVFYSTIFFESAPLIAIDLEDPQVQNHFPDLSYDIVINNLDLWNIY